MPTQLGSLLVLRDLSNDAFMLAIQIKERFNLKNNIKATFNLGLLLLFANSAASFQQYQPSHVLLELPQSRRKTMANFEKLLLQYRVTVSE